MALEIKILLFGDQTVDPNPLITVAALAVTTSTSQLLKLAPEIVRIALRLGLEARRRSTQIERSNDSWARIVPGLAPREQQKALDLFHVEHSIPTNKKAYISAETDASATISGPPSTLESLFLRSETFRNARTVKLPITAAFHASHLRRPDIANILGPLANHNNLPIRDHVQIVATSSGQPITARNLGELLQQVFFDALQEPLRWSKVKQQLVSSSRGRAVHIISAGPVRAADGLLRDMKADGIEKLKSTEMQPPQRGITSNSLSDIAIVGFASRMPEAETLDEVWRLLEDGRDAHEKFPGDRLNIDTHCDPTGKAKNTIITPYGCFLDQPGLFDARLFNMSPREAAQTDPAQRLLLLTTYEALEMAGYTPNGSPSYAGERIGTFFGQTLDDYREANASQDIEMYYVTGGIRAFGPGRLNYHFKWEGPSYCVDAACSSSALSIQMGVAALRSRECDTAVAGGTNILTGSDMSSGLSRGSFLSPTGPCKTFDNDADGYCRGEGVGSVVLKRLDDAIAEGDNIQGIIRSAATNHSAFASSITHPHAGAQQSLMRQVLRDAHLSPDDIDYVEMHGTGTQAGDATEFSSVTNVLSGRSKHNPLHVGAIKANVGHAEAAAGVNSLTKILLMMRKNTIPPHIGIKGRINEKFPPLDKVNVCIDRTLSPFKARVGGDGKRRVLLNNFNATGGNTSLIIEDGMENHPEGVDPRTAHVVTISAKTPGSFKQNTERLLKHIDSNPGIRLQDLAYTTTARRMHHMFRKAFAAESLDQLTEAMRSDLASASAPKPATETSSAIFVFTGQGQQYIGMGRRLLETSTAFRKAITDCNEICIRQGLPSFEGLLTSDSVDKMSPSQSQLALVSIAIALASLWKSWGIAPTAVIGHSLGEYAALCVAEVLSVSDTLYLVGKRAEMMERKCDANSHAMVVVQANAELVQQVINDASAQSCQIACLNGPASTVVSGESADIGLLGEKLQAGGIKKTVLDLPYAFHSAQMEPILEDIRVIAQNVNTCEPSVPVASTLLGSVVRNKSLITPDYFVRQTRNPVKFQGALEALRADGLASDETLWMEIGAHPLCLGMVRSTLGLSPTKALPSLKRDENCWSTIARSVANAYNSGANISWTDHHQEYRKSLKLLELPTYAFDLKKYWLDYQGDWLLTKGDANKSVTPVPQPTFYTTTLQQIESELFTRNSASVSFLSQLGNAKLNAAVRGHIVNGIGLCPSSVYADVAFSAARYIATRMAPSEPLPAMDLSNMEVFRPLIVDAGQTSQILKVSASRQANERTVDVIISSRDSQGSHDHARCTVRYGNGKDWMQEWQKNAYLVRSRMDQLIRPSKPANVHRLLKEMIYRQFQTVVTYSEQYHTIDELFMDCELNESVANIRFQPLAEHGDFLYSPYWIDTVAHHGGFVLNASVNTPADTVFISHGWESFRIAGTLSANKDYQGYVRMQPSGSRGVMAGDMYIFDGDEIVVLCKGLKFQRMKRNVLHSLLGTSHEAEPVRKPQQSSMHKTVQSHEVPQASSSEGFSGVLATIAAEIGMDTGELTDDAKISDLGVDSLLTITILGKLRTQTGLDLPSSLFVTYSTVAALKGYFLDRMVASSSLINDGESDRASTSQSPAYTSWASTALSSAPSTPPPKEAEAPDASSIMLAIIAQEVGISATEILPSTSLAEIGVDSLLTITILDAFKTQTGKSLAATFFQDNTTVAKIQKVLGVRNSTLPPAVSPPSKLTREAQPLKVQHRSKSVLLQGRPVPSKPALFLLPDGAGSLFSYINLPSLPSGVAVYGLDSPFHNNPADYQIPFEEVASIYIREIRTLQPQGPYMIGGWSLGGIHAYETAYQLIQQGESITSLIMIDSPCPGTLPPLPSPTLNLLEKAGVFDGLSSSSGPISERTRLHFLSSVRALENYTVAPLPPGKSPEKVTVVWAKDGVLDGRSEMADEIFGESSPGDDGDERVKDMDIAKQWLSGKRTSFGPSGWDKLTGTTVECHVVGGNHFSVMFPPKISDVAVAVAKADTMLTNLAGRIDVHHHYLPPAYFDAIKDTQSPGGWNNPHWSPSISKAFMTAHNISTVIFSVSTPGIDIITPTQSIKIARQCNEYGAQLRDSDPTSFGFFAMIPDPLTHTQAAVEEIEYSLDVLKADGVCLLTRYGKGNSYLGHEEYQPLWDALDARNAVVFIHPSQPADPNIVNPALPAPVIDFPHETCRAAVDLVVSNTLSTHPNCKIILSHSGGTLPYLAPRVAAIVPMILKSMPPHRHHPPKTTSQILSELQNFYFDVALGSDDLVLPLLTRFAKPGHVLFGSDVPYAPRPVIDFFMGKLDEWERGVSGEEKFKIDWGNALGLFPRFREVGFVGEKEKGGDIDGV
ncbi:MAG: hypothetical protein LQ350_005364 [Teloschistes chrysophthalmus]|nr:MAG: hypothetical protein LQ350_005364 [Niorma chrysophthalma]